MSQQRHPSLSKRSFQQNPNLSGQRPKIGGLPPSAKVVTQYPDGVSTGVGGGNAAASIQPPLAKITNPRPTQNPKPGPAGSGSGSTPGTTSGGKPTLPPSAQSSTGAKIAAANNPSTPTPTKLDPSTQSLRYPVKMSSVQDVIKFSVVEYVPVGATLTRSSARSLGKPGGSPAGKTLATIYLPMPNDINAANSLSWSEGSVDSFAALAYQASIGLMGVDNKAELATLGSELKAALEATGLMGKDGVEAAKSALATAAASALTGANIDMNTIFARTTGQVINPNKELLFGGVNLREFTYSFIFSPRSLEEGQVVRKIIHTFKKHSAAKSGTKGGFFLSSPEVFQIQYLHRDAKEHPFLNKLKVCALKSIAINYTGSSVYSTYYDGTPTHIVMGLTFGEIEPIYYEDYEDSSDSSDAGTGY